MSLEQTINDAFARASEINSSTKGEVRDAVNEALALLDAGKARVAEKIAGETGPQSWKVNQWLKKAVLLSFRLNDMSAISGAPGGASWWDKVPSKFDGWTAAEHGAGRLPLGARLRRAPLGLHRARRRADALLRQSRRLCRFRHDGGHVGDGRLVRADRQERASVGRRRHRRRARAAAGRTRRSSRTIASSARARKSSRA